MQWQPYDMIIINVGDPNAGHSGSKGGLHIGAIQVMQAKDDLGVWPELLDDLNFGDA